MIGIVVGTRPEIVKMAPVIWELERKGAAYKLVHTGQHYDYNMSKVFFDELCLRKPDTFLGVGSASRAEQIQRVLQKMSEAIKRLGITIVCVEGDTNSVMGAALTAKKNNCLLAHVESGARSFDKSMPEEINRIETDRLSDVRFAPTQNCVENLKREGITKNVFLSGNTELETLAFALKKKRAPPFGVPKRFALATLHRQANAREGKIKHLWNLFESLSLPVLFLVHPRTEKVLEKGLRKSAPENVLLQKPVGYFELIWLLKKSTLALTDSGGLQVETAELKKPLLILRNETEWIEVVKANAGALIGLDEKSGEKAKRFLTGFKPKAHVFKGNAAQRIVSKLLEFDS